jgi:hypothetical protein
MKNSALNVGDDLAGIGLVPAPVQLLGGQPELDEKVAGVVLRFDLATLLLPKAEKGSLVAAHDDPGIGAANEVATTRGFSPHAYFQGVIHRM